MSLQNRGGIARIRNYTVATAPTAGQAGNPVQLVQLTTRLVIRTTTNPAVLYFTQEDFDNSVNGWNIATGEAGKFDQPVEARQIWLHGSGGASDVEILQILRVG